MGIRALYSGDLHGEAFQRLQSMRVHENSSEPQRFITKIEGPELLDDGFLINWLAMNYLWATDFDHENNPIMGEIGGTISPHPDDGKLVLAIAKASMGKTMYGIQQVKESRRTGDTNIISQLEREIEMPLRSTGGVTVVNGNRNIGHYDFTTSVARTKPIELLTTNAYLLFSAEGFTVASNKQLRDEQYIFNIPVNEELFRGMRDLKTDDYDNKLEFLRTTKDHLLPKQFIAGFHIRYDRNAVIVRPLIAQRDSNVSLEDFGVTASLSPLAYLGTSSAHGPLVGVMEKRILD